MMPWKLARGDFADRQGMRETACAIIAIEKGNRRYGDWKPDKGAKNNRNLCAHHQKSLNLPRIFGVYSPHWSFTKSQRLHTTDSQLLRQKPTRALKNTKPTNQNGIFFQHIRQKKQCQWNGMESWRYGRLHDAHQSLLPSRHGIEFRYPRFPHAPRPPRVQADTESAYRKQQSRTRRKETMQKDATGNLRHLRQLLYRNRQ